MGAFSLAGRVSGSRSAEGTGHLPRSRIVLRPLRRNAIAR